MSFAGPDAQLGEVFRPKLPTPDTSHVSADAWEHVYEPAEDSFALLDALERSATLNPAWWARVRVAAEVGCGSGVISAFLATSVLPPQATMFATDVNPAALAVARTVVPRQRVHLLRTSLLDALSRRAAGLLDLIVFNPPYVPSPDDELGHTNITASWAGGAIGTCVLEDLVPQLPHLLAPHGAFVCVFVRENQPDLVRQRLQQQHGFRSRCLLQRSAGTELLSIVIFWRP